MLGIGNSISKISSSKISSGSFLFVFSVKTDNSGTSNNDQFTLPLTTSSNLDITVEWGDGNTDNITSHTANEVTHTYASSGEYIIKIDGTLRGFQFNGQGDKLKIKNVSNWGVMGFDKKASFNGCANLTCTAVDAVTVISNSLQSTFLNCTNFNGAIGNWDVSNVTNFRNMFSASSFNNDISAWSINTSANIDMTQMFLGTTFNQDISSWNTSRVTNMSSMFRTFSGVEQTFNQDISSWDVSNVTNFSSMFRDNEAFNQNLNSWDVSSCFNFAQMFQGCNIFNQPLSNWNMSSATSINQMFRNSLAFNQDLSSWDVSNVISFYGAFRNADNYDQNLGSWDLSSATSIADFLRDSDGLSTNNYDSTLEGWANTGVPNGLTCNFGGSKYTSGGTAEAARNTLINTYNWTIIDGGTA